MNQYSGYVQAVPNGFRAMLRFARDARPNPLMGEGGKPEIFPTEAEAWQAVTTHLLRYFNSPMFRCGDVVKSTARAEADRLFRPGKKPIAIERRKVVA